ncbi:MAG: hypothetical protein ABR875_03125 [Minisyncoccia bacterium]
MDQPNPMQEQNNPMQNQNPSMSVPPMPPVEPKKKFNLKFWIPALVVVVIALVAIWLYGRYISQMDNNIVTSMNNASQTATPRPSATPQNSFANPDGGYSFEVPAGWNVAVNKYNNKNSLFSPNADSGSGLGGVEVFGGYSSIDAFLGGVSAQYTNKTSVTIDGISGIRTQYKGSASSGEQAVLIKNGTIYNIYVNSESQQDVSLFDQILSTFKFTQ